MIFTRLKKTLGTIISLLISGLFLLQTLPVYAETARDLQFPYYDPNAAVGVGCASDSTVLVGSANAEKIFNYLIAKGLTPIQVAGIMGNMQAEAHFEPRLVEYGWKNSRGEISSPGNDSSLDDVVPPDQNDNGQPGYGIVQWTSPGRKQGLRDAAKAANKKGGDLGLQLDYLWQELEGSYKNNTLDPIKNATTIREATKIFLFEFERPANMEQKLNLRVKFAKAILAKYGSNEDFSASASDSLICESSGEIVGGFSLPVARKWYDKYPNEFTDDHHSPPPAVDISIPTGTPVYAVAGGKITKAPIVNITCSGCKSGSYGRGVEIDSGNGVTFIYAHGTDGGSVPGAREGDIVEAGQLIMHSGNTGNSSGPHLHFEIRLDGQEVCPQTFLVGIAEGNVPQIKSLPTTGCYK